MSQFPILDTMLATFSTSASQVSTSYTSTRARLLLIPPILPLLSIAILVCKAGLKRLPLFRSQKKNDGGLPNSNGTLLEYTDSNTDEHSSESIPNGLDSNVPFKHEDKKLLHELEAYMYDGPTIFAFRLARFVACLILLVLEVIDFADAKEHGRKEALGQAYLGLYIYTALLSLATLTPFPRLRDISTSHLTILLFVDFVVYFTLDAWPYATLVKQTFHSPEDIKTWLRLGSLAVGGVGVTVLVPWVYRPKYFGAVPAVEDVSSILSKWTFAFMDSLIIRAYRKDIKIENMPPLATRRTAEVLTRRAFPHLDPLLLGKKRYVLWGLIRVFGKDYAMQIFYLALSCVTAFSGPYGMRNVLKYLESGSSPLGIEVWVWIIVLAYGPAVSELLFQQHFFIAMRVLSETESVLTQLVFEHTLRIRLRDEGLDKLEESGKRKVGNKKTKSKPKQGTDEVGSDKDKRKDKTGAIIGKINNLVTTDMMRVRVGQNLLQVPNGMVQIVISVVFLYDLLGWSALIGLAVLVACLPIPTYISKQMLKVQKSKMNLTDQRIQAVTDTLNVIRMVKLFGWEPHMLSKISKLRDSEMKKIRTSKLMNVVMIMASTALPLLARLIVFAAYTLIMKKELNASVIFSALLLFDILKNQLHYVIRRIPEILEAKVSYDRFTQFLNNTELLPSVKPTEGNAPVVPQDSINEIGFNACTFSWDPFVSDTTSASNMSEGGPEAGDERRFYLSFDEKVVFKQGCINLITGPTASGKTSVLMALLGEMYYKPRDAESWFNLPRGDDVAYAAQESWVLNGTIKDNILFGKKCDEERYKKVLKQCALERDLSLWEAGDLTEVGEKGLTLSGGQKARVTLARALYSQASILLLDDVLAALDVHTAKWVVDEALKGDLIHGRTVLLVTHNLALTAPIADYAICLGRQGNVEAQGPVSEVLKSSSTLRQLVDKQDTEIDDAVDKVEETGKMPDKTTKKGKLVVAEEKQLGRVEWAALKLYFVGIGGVSMWSIWLALICITSLVNILQTWFVGQWSSQYQDHAAADVPVLRYFAIYAFATVGVIFTDASRRAFWIFRSIRASKAIHRQLLDSIFNASFRWLDVTPMGRIITRCTQDIASVDGQYASFLSGFVALSIDLVMLFVITVVAAGWYALIPGLLISGLGGYLGHIYLRAQLSVRRELSIAKAPIMGHIGMMLSGLQSIRAYGAQTQFRAELNKHVDTLVRVSLTSFNINRWISFRADMLGGSFAAVVTGYLVYGTTVKAGGVGFTLSLVLTFAGKILVWVRTYNVMEVHSNSLERILGFLRIEHEPSAEESSAPPAYWPSSGTLRVESLSARYAEGSPDVLNEISFELKSGERVGVVGRTGAGKSSIALALLRALKVTGKVYYDGVDTEKIDLHSLRSHITLIPQQPELISGSIRENLDPFGEHDDAVLNEALHAAQLHEVGQSQSTEDQSGGQGGSKSNVGLDTTVEKGGTNFSMGQRQIIALARAIVRKSKLLILDEATAAIDYSTDTAIQKTLRTEFGSDTTLITIAHRLQTIMDYDKIMVLDAGRLIEFDSPKVLLLKEDGAFRRLVDNSDDSETLKAMIK